MSDMFLHKCPNCNATLEFDIESGMVECSFCGSRFDVNSLKTEATVKPDGENKKKKKDKDKAEPKEFDWGSYKSGLKHEDLSGTVSYICETCGAEVILDATAASSKCSYCDNFLILSENVSAGLRPNGIIPFKILPKDLPRRVREFYKDKKLLPYNFFADNKLGSARGIYVPFWLYNCRMSGNVKLSGSTVTTRTDGSYRITETSVYDIDRDGEMEFERIPVDASIRMPDALMDSIEPFDYSQLVEFNSGYLTGFSADRFDSDPDENLPRVNERVRVSAENMILNSVSSYSSVSVQNNDLKMSDQSVKYVMLPVYLFECKYAGKTYSYAANGQTGKVVGDLPVSRGKSFLNFFIPFLVAAGIIAAVLFLLF